MTDIPQWAFERADNLFRESCHSAHPWRDAFARYIAEHEDEPVDPLLIEAREIVANNLYASRAGSHCSYKEVLEGKRDNQNAVQAALAALKSREPQS